MERQRGELLRDERAGRPDEERHDEDRDRRQTDEPVGAPGTSGDGEVPEHQRQDHDRELLERHRPPERDRREDERDPPETAVAIREHEKPERQHDDESGRDVVRAIDRPERPDPPRCVQHRGQRDAIPPHPEADDGDHDGGEDAGHGVHPGDVAEERVRRQVPEQLARRIHERRARGDRRGEWDRVRVEAVLQVEDGFLRRPEHVAAIEQRRPREALADADEHRPPADEFPLVAPGQAQAEEDDPRDEQDHAVELRCVELDPADAPEQAGEDRRVIGP